MVGFLIGPSEQPCVEEDGPHCEEVRCDQQSGLVWNGLCEDELVGLRDAS